MYVHLFIEAAYIYRCLGIYSWMPHLFIDARATSNSIQVERGPGCFRVQATSERTAGVRTIWPSLSCKAFPPEMGSVVRTPTPKGTSRLCTVESPSERLTKKVLALHFIALPHFASHCFALCLCIALRCIALLSIVSLSLILSVFPWLVLPCMHTLIDPPHVPPLSLDLRGGVPQASGDIIIADKNNHRIQKCNPASPGSPCTTIAGWVIGGRTWPNGRPKGGKSNKELNGPNAVAIDAALLEI